MSGSGQSRHWIHDLEANEAYQRGQQSELVKQREAESRAARAFTDKVLQLLAPATTLPPPVDRKRSTPTSTQPATTFPGFMYAGQRAVEHIVTDLDPSTAATPHGVFTTGTSNELAQAFVDTWSADAMRATQYANLVEQTNGVPMLPKMTTPATAGPQDGEKTEAYSKAFDITNDDAATLIDSTLMLNVSMLIDAHGGKAIVQGFMKSAVMAEANRQIVDAIRANATTATDIGDAFGMFNGSRFTPTVVVVPPGELMTTDVQRFTLAGITVVVEPAATQTLVLDRNASIGWFMPVEAMAEQPAVNGTAVGYGIFGKVSVDATGVAVVAPV